MDRLTARNEQGQAYLVNVKDNEQEVEASRNTCQCLYDSWQRLAAYEDIGTPEQCAAGVALMQKQEQGLVVELPCRVCDTVHHIGKMCAYRGDCPRQEWYEIFGDFGERCPDMGHDECDHCGVHEVMFSFSNMGSILGQIGKIVFLTRAEAENAIREGV